MLFEDEEDFDYSCKVIFVGDSNVGKSTIVYYQCHSKFEGSIPMTVGMSNSKTIIRVRSNTIELKVWDTAGQERYNSLIPVFSRGAQVCVFVADITKPETIKNLKKWKESLVIDENYVPAFIIAINKMDLLNEDQYPETEDEDLQQQIGFEHDGLFFTSAKTGYNIELLFKEAARLFVDKLKTRKKFESKTLPLDKKIGSCC